MPLGPGRGMRPTCGGLHSGHSFNRLLPLPIPLDGNQFDVVKSAHDGKFIAIHEVLSRIVVADGDG
jgi:hypothetical protein